MQFVVSKILQHIVLNLDGVIPKDFDTWISFYEIGPKTASLLLWSAFRIQTTLPVDSHVWHAFKKWGWTNALSAAECSWQAGQWMPPSQFITTNDVIGSIRQKMQMKGQRRIVIGLAQSQIPELLDKIKLL
jgi:endonuclease III